MVTRLQVIEEARTYLETPFHHQGRVKGLGIDCAGLVIGVGKHLGLSMFDTKNYARTPNGNEMKQLLDKHAEQGHGIPGDILLMTFLLEPQHLAIMTTLPDGEPGIIHAYASARKCVEHRLDSQWEKRVVAVYSYPCLED